MKLAFFDIETTGLDAEKDRIIEVGCCLFDWDTQVPLKLYSEFVQHPGLVIPTEATEINGITNDMVKDWGVPEDQACLAVGMMMANADYVVAHNGRNFDKLFWDKWKSGPGIFGDRPWLDTIEDLPYPKHITTRNLLHLAAEHGFTPPIHLRHRAIFDVMTTIELLSHYCLEDVIALSKVPWVYVASNVDFDHNALAKDRLYRFHNFEKDGPPKGKFWWKKLRENTLKAELDYWSGTRFQICIIDGKGLK